MVDVAEPVVARATHELTVAVELDRSLAELADGSAAGELRKITLAHLKRLTADLGLPATPSVSIAPGRAESALPGRYRVRIGGVSCGPVLPSELDEEVTPSRVGAEIARTVAQNRRLCLTPEVAEELATAWQALNPRLERVVAPEVLREGLGKLLLRCVSVAPRVAEPLENCPGRLEAAPVSADDLCEAALGGTISLRVFVGRDLEAAIVPEPQPGGRPYSSDVQLALAHASIVDVLHEELGLLVPPVTFEVDPVLEDGEFAVQINHLRFPPLHGLTADEAMVNATRDELALDGHDVRRGRHPFHGHEVTVVRVDDETLETLGAQGYATWGPEGYVAFSLAREVRRHAGALLHPDVTRFCLERVRATYPLVVDTALRRFGRDQIDAVVRRLLDEQVPVHDLVGILEGMLAVTGGVRIDQSRYRVVAPNIASRWPIREDGGDAPGAGEYADCVRRHLRGQITTLFTAGSKTISTFHVDESLEARLRELRTRPLEEDERERLSAAVWTAYGPVAGTGQTPFVLTNSEIRRPLSRLLRTEFPALAVMSTDELEAGTRVQTLNRIVWTEHEERGGPP